MRFFVLSGGMFHKERYCTSVPNPNSMDLHSRMVDIEQKLDALKGPEDFAQLRQDVQQQMSSISADVKRLADQLDKIQQKIDGQDSEGTDTDTHENMVELTVKEIKAREDCGRSLYVFNLPQNTGPDVSTRRFQDRYQLDKLFNDDMKLNVEILNTFRYTKDDTVKVEFSSGEDRLKVIRSLPILHMNYKMEPMIRFRARVY